MVIKACLGRPAQINSRSDIPVTPFHHLCQLIPVIHIFKFHIFNRSPGDDHTIEFKVFYLVEFNVKFIQMAGGGIFGLMSAHSHKSNIHLERSVGEGTKQLQFCLLLERHQVQYQYLDRTYILVNSPVFIHYKYILTFQYFFCWQITLYSNRHYFHPLINIEIV